VFLSNANLAQAISSDCNDRSWHTRTNPGFSAITCNGTGFPVFNAIVDYRELHYNIPGDERKFSWVRLQKRADGTVPNHNSLTYKGFVRHYNTTANIGESFMSYIYLHNNGNPSRNSTGESIARNVKLKALGFERDSDGEYYIKPAAGTNTVTIQNSIEASNTSPNSRVDSYKINIPVNSKLKLRTDVQTVLQRTPCHELSPPSCITPETETKNSLDLVSDGMNLTSTSTNGIEGEFFGSQGYRMLNPKFVRVYH
jgi:hypothetical protein